MIFFMTPTPLAPSYIALISALVFLILNLGAASFGYFNAEPYKRKTLYLSDIFLIFTAFIATQFLIVPLIAYGLVSYSAGHLVEVSSIDLIYKNENWLPIMGIILGSLAPILYNWISKKVDWGNPARLLEDLNLAFLSWFLAFPAAVTVSKLVELVSQWLGYGEQPDQLAVQLVKESFADPHLFFRLVATIVVLVPLAEEMLFRGYLQGYLITRMERWKAIAITSLCFVAFHFSPSQGFTNVTVLLSLFPLSCYLGFLREKQQSLWAPAMLHGTFNLISVLMLASQGVTNEI